MSEVGGTAAATTGATTVGSSGSSSGDSSGSVSNSAPGSTPASPPQVSTSDVASSVIDAFEATETTGGGAGSDEEFGDVRAAAGEAPPPPPPDPNAPLSDEDRLLQEFGFTKQFQPNGREYYIPRSKALKMIASGLKRGQEKWGTEKTQYQQQVQQYHQHLEQLVAGVRGDPRAFLAELAQHDPRYQAFLQGNGNGHSQLPDAPPDPYGNIPQPDLPLSDGSSTYSLDGIQKQLIPWLTQAIKADLKRERQQEQQQEQQTAQQRQAAQQANRQRVSSLMQEATTWPMFGAISPDGKLSQFQAEVMQTFMADKSLDLRAAYMKVALPRLTADRNKTREELLQEINGAPRSTAVAHQGTERRPAGPLTTAEIAARTIDRLERGR